MCHCAKENRKTKMMHHNRLLIALTVCIGKMNMDIGYRFHHSILQNNERCLINFILLGLSVFIDFENKNENNKQLF